MNNKLRSKTAQQQTAQNDTARLSFKEWKRACARRLGPDTQVSWTRLHNLLEHTCSEKGETKQDGTHVVGTMYASYIQISARQIKSNLTSNESHNGTKRIANKQRKHAMPLHHKTQISWEPGESLGVMETREQQQQRIRLSSAYPG